MSNVPEALIRQLCISLQIDEDFFVQCLEESVVEIREIDGRLELANASALHLRRLERICVALEIPVTAGLMLSQLTRRVAELEEEVRRLKSR